MRISRHEHALPSTKRSPLLLLLGPLDPDPEIISFCADPGPGARTVYARGKNCITDARCDQSFSGVERNCRASCVYAFPFERGNHGSANTCCSRPGILRPLSPLLLVPASFASCFNIPEETATRLTFPSCRHARTPFSGVRRPGDQSSRNLRQSNL